MLVYKDGNFLEVLEGPELAVKETYARILKDPRHRGHILLLEGPRAERDFPQWTMGFRDLASDDLDDIEGFDQFMNEPLRQARIDKFLNEAAVQPGSGSLVSEPAVHPVSGPPVSEVVIQPGPVAKPSRAWKLLQVFRRTM